LEKYLEEYLSKMASPSVPSFTTGNLEVLTHPEVAILKSDKISIPNFDQVNINSNLPKMVTLSKSY